MEQDAPTSWLKSIAAPPSARPTPCLSIDEDAEAYLRATGAALEADQAFLTLRPDDDPEAAVHVAFIGRALSGAAHDQVAALGTVKGTTSNERRTYVSEPEWSTCMLDQRSWHVLRLPIWSRRAQTILTLQLLFRTASLADRSRTLLKLQTLRPLLEPYFRLWQRARAHLRGSAGLKGALDAMEMGILLVDRSSRIIFANATANRIMAEGEPLRRLGESFTASDVRQVAPLQVALSHAIASNADSSVGAGLARRASVLALKSHRLGHSLMLSLMPTEACAVERPDAAAAIYITDPQMDLTKHLRPVCALFGLSPVESRLVCLLTAGQALHDAAEVMRIKDQTARSYLKQIFLKTDTGRQADLVRVMLCSLLRVEQGSEPLFIKSDV